MTKHQPYTAHAADFFEGSRPEERTLIDYCRTPFSFGLVLAIPVTLMVWAFVVVLQSRPVLKIMNRPESATVFDVLTR